MTDENGNRGAVIATQGRASAGELVAMTADQILGRRETVKRVMNELMTEGLHYGTIPGTGGRLALLKEGAELLLSTFQIGVQPVVVDLSSPQEVRFQVECRGIHQPTGTYLGSGLGVCTSNEEKYRWRAARSPREWDLAEASHRRTKYERDGEIRQVRQSPWDAVQTIMSMAKKRATVDLAKTVLAASESLKGRVPQSRQTSRPAPAQNGGGQRQTAPARPAAAPASAPAKAAEPAPPPPVISDDQVESLGRRLDNAGIPDNAFLARYELGRIGELEAARYEEAIKWIESISP